MSQPGPATAPDPRRYLLSDADSDRIFRGQIIPRELAHGVPQTDPVVVFVAGQPGAGKTKTTQMIQARLDERGGAIGINSDFYKPFHPQYARLLREDDRNAAAYTSMDGRRWMAAAEHWAIEHRVDALIETTMRDPGDFAEPARMFRDAGYRVEVAVLAVPEAQSRLGIVHRYHEQVATMGHGRLTLTANHDAAYTGVLQAATDIDHNRTVDAVAVYRRGNIELYANHLRSDGAWNAPPGARRAIEAERHRPWTPEETRRFIGTLEHLSEQMGPEWRPHLAEIAVLARPFATADATSRAAPGRPTVSTEAPARRTPAPRHQRPDHDAGHSGR